jgi:tetratricopeptide (TPR) repeat protein
LKRPPTAALQCGMFVAALLCAPVAGATGVPWHLASPADKKGSPAETARRLFDAGAYSRGLSVLQKARIKLEHAPGEQARVLATMAMFFARYGESFDAAERLLNEILRLGLPADHAELVAARKNLQQLRAQAARYSAENAALDRICIERYDAETHRSRVEELEALIQRRPDFPRLASAHYYLGKNHLLLKSYRKAFYAFDRALELRPALGCCLPAEVDRGLAFNRWVHEDLSTAAWVVIGLFLAISLWLFYRSRPWKTLGLRHAVVLGALVGLWWLCLRLGVWVLGKTISHQTDIFPQPVYLDTAFGSPMSGVLDPLFRYGLVGVLGVFVFAVSVAGLKRRYTRALLCGTVALVLFSSLMTLFYMEHGTKHVLFRPAQEGRYSYLRGGFYHGLADGQDPFILTAPRTYCRFQKTIDELDEVEVKQWFRRYARFCDER